MSRRLNDNQREVLALLVLLGGWRHRDEVTDLTDLRSSPVGQALNALHRRGYVVHSDSKTNVWMATPKAHRVAREWDEVAA